MINDYVYMYEALNYINWDWICTNLDANMHENLMTVKL